MKKLLFFLVMLLSICCCNYQTSRRFQTVSPNESEFAVGKYSVIYKNVSDNQIAEVANYPYKAIMDNNTIEDESALWAYLNYAHSRKVLSLINEKLCEKAPVLMQKITENSKNEVRFLVNSDGGVNKVSVTIKPGEENIEPEEVVALTEVMSNLNLKSPAYFGYYGNTECSYLLSMIKNKYHRTKFFVRADTINTDIVEYYKENNSRWAYVANYPYKNERLSHIKEDGNKYDYKGFESAVLSDDIIKIRDGIRKAAPSLFTDLKKNDTGFVSLSINREGYVTNARFSISNCESCLSSEDIITLTKVFENMTFTKPLKYGLSNDTGVNIKFTDIAK